VSAATLSWELCSH